MTNLLERLRRTGAKSVLSLLWIRSSKKLLHIAYVPAWYLFKLRNLGLTYAKISTAGENPGIAKESNIRKILSGIPNGRFLEIGIGEFPHFERLKLMNEQSISYTGCDFKSVSESHRKELAIKNFDTRNISFATNSTGTYSWTLFEMLQRGERFDVIYVDGHHTFYIDLPAMVLADKLLKPGGYLLLDDMEWSLSFLKTNMLRSLSQWYFYRTMYDFSQYTKEQQSLPHIKMIANELFVKHSGYTKDEGLSLPHWWTLRKKA